MNPIESHLLLILGKGLALSAAFFVLALVLLRGRSAQAVSHFWRTVLAGLMIVPTVSLLLPWLHVAMPGQGTEVLSAVAAEPVISDAVVVIETTPVVVTTVEEGSLVGIAASPVPEAGTPMAMVDTPVWSTWRPTLLLGIWALGFAMVLGRWALSWGRVRRLVKSGADGGFAMWERDMARFREAGQRVRLVISEGVQSPMVFGLWRPVLLLPSDSDAWDGEKRRQVLLHELCHVRRRDPLFLLLARVTVALHWINPLAWLAAKRLRLAEERTADDAVLADGRDPAEYASLLAGFARCSVSGPKGLPVVAPSMASASTVRSRVQRILDAQQRRGAPRPIARFGFGLLVCTAVLVAGGLSFSPVAAEEKTPAKATEDKKEPSWIEGEQEVIPVVGAMTMFKAKNIIIPVIDFDESTLEEAVDFLRLRSKELDRIEADPNKKGLNFVVIGAETAKRVIPRLQLKNVPLASALDFICQQTETSYEAGEFAITIKDAKGAAAAPAQPVDLAKGDGALVMAKLERIIIPAVKFEEATLDEALDFLRHRSRELDVAEKDPEKKGLNIVLRGMDLGARRIKSLNLVNVPLNLVMRYVCELTKTEYKVDAFAVTIVDAAMQPANDLITRTFLVPPRFAWNLLDRVAGAAGNDPFGPRPKMRPLVELLRDSGVDFSEKAGVSFVPETSRLIVRARQANLDLVEVLIAEMMRDLPSLIKLRIELYEVPKVEALKIAKQNADKNEGSGAYRMVEELIVPKKARLLSSPTIMVRPGQRGTMQSGSELDYVAAYLEKDGEDVPIMRKALVGSNIVIEPNIGVDGQVLDIRYELTMTRGEPKVSRRTVQAPVSGRDVEVETVLIDTLTLSQGLTTMAGQTQFLGMMQSSMKVDNPNEIMVFLTATVTKVRR